MEKEQGRKRMYKFKVSGSSLCGFAVLSLFLPNLHTEEEHVRDKKKMGLRRGNPSRNGKHKARKIDQQREG